MNSRNIYEVKKANAEAIQAIIQRYANDKKRTEALLALILHELGVSIIGITSHTNTERDLAFMQTDADGIYQAVFLDFHSVVNLTLKALNYECKTFLDEATASLRSNEVTGITDSIQSLFKGMLGRKDSNIARNRVALLYSLNGELVKTINKNIKDKEKDENVSN